MLRLVLKVARRAKAAVGIGDAVALAAQGYRRDTMDVDAFFHYADRQRVLRALQLLAGSDYKIESLDTSHWVAVPVGADPDERIDLLFATGDPEESAIESAQPKSYRGVVGPMIPVEWIVVCKYLAERDDAKDWLDIYALHQRGLFEIRDIVRRLTQMGQANDAKRFVAFMANLKNLKK